MNAIEVALLFRGVERLMIVFGEIFALYLGYRLFVRGFVGGQEGELLGKSLTIRLVKVGPGIFFALFGTCVLTAMTWQSIVMSPAGEISNPTNLSFFGTTEKSRLERIIEDIGAIKTLIIKEHATTDQSVSSLTTSQKNLARTFLGNEIYEKCEFDAENESDQDCEIYKSLIK